MIQVLVILVAIPLIFTALLALYLATVEAWNAWKNAPREWRQ